MATGIESFTEDLRSPKLGVGGADAAEGPGSYDRLIRVLRELGDEPALFEPLATAWHGRSFETVYARPLLLLASLRFRALCTPDHPLALELLMDAEAPDLAARTREALADPELVAVLATRSVQTNEPGRAFSWGLAAMTLGLGHRAFHLADLGCSAGLDLVVDRTAIPYRLGMNKLAGFDFPSPERRLGLDHAPIDVRDPREARWLEACIWPGQPERLERFKACRAVYERPWQGQAPAPELTAHTLGEDLTLATLDALARDGRATIAFESVVRPYLSEAARARHDENLWRFVEGGRERIWLVLEPSDKPSPSTPMTLTAHLARGGERHAFALAQSGYHTSSCVLVPGATRKLAELWAVA